MSTALNNMKIEVGEYESLVTEYEAIKDDIESCTSCFFLGIFLMEEEGIIDGHVAKNLKTYSEQVSTILDDELVEILELIARAITNTCGFTYHIQETDQFIV